MRELEKFLQTLFEAGVRTTVDVDESLRFELVELSDKEWYEKLKSGSYFFYTKASDSVQGAYFVDSGRLFLVKFKYDSTLLAYDFSFQQTPISTEQQTTEQLEEEKAELLSLLKSNSLSLPGRSFDASTSVDRSTFWNKIFKVLQYHRTQEKDPYYSYYGYEEGGKKSKLSQKSSKQLTKYLYEEQYKNVFTAKYLSYFTDSKNEEESAKFVDFVKKQLNKVKSEAEYNKKEFTTKVNSTANFVLLLHNYTKEFLSNNEFETSVQPVLQLLQKVYDKKVITSKEADELYKLETVFNTYGNVDSLPRDYVKAAIDFLSALGYEKSLPFGTNLKEFYEFLVFFSETVQSKVKKTAPEYGLYKKIFEELTGFKVKQLQEKLTVGSKQKTILSNYLEDLKETHNSYEEVLEESKKESYKNFNFLKYDVAARSYEVVTEATKVLEDYLKDTVQYYNFSNNSKLFKLATEFENKTNNFSALRSKRNKDVYELKDAVTVLNTVAALGAVLRNSNKNLSELYLQLSGAGWQLLKKYKALESAKSAFSNYFRSLKNYLESKAEVTKLPINYYEAIIRESVNSFLKQYSKLFKRSSDYEARVAKLTTEVYNFLNSYPLEEVIYKGNWVPNVETDKQTKEVRLNFGGLLIFTEAGLITQFNAREKLYWKFLKERNVKELSYNGTEIIFKL